MSPKQGSDAHRLDDESDRRTSRRLRAAARDSVLREERAILEKPASARSVVTAVGQGVHSQPTGTVVTLSP
jgi:hypothetical protein